MARIAHALRRRAPMPPAPSRGAATARETRLSRGAALAGALSAGAALPVLAGWMLEGERLRTLVPGSEGMTANTALMTLLCGLSLCLLAKPSSSRAAPRAGRVLAAAVLLIALLTAVEYAFGTDLGIDTLLARGGRLGGVAFPGRPSPHTTTTFVFLSSALLLLDVLTARGRRPAPWAALAAGSIAAIALLGRLFQAGALYGLPAMPRTYMALLTASLLLALSMGALAARPHDWPVSLLVSRGTGGMAARSLLLGLLAFLGLACVFALYARLGRLSAQSALSLTVFAAFAQGAANILRTAGRLERADRERRGAEERYRALVERSPDGIFTADLAGRYTDVNPAGCRLLGLSREELLGKTIVDLIPPEEEERLWREREKMLEGRAWTSQWRLRRKDGSYVPVEVNANILPGGRWQGFVRDLTERERAQAEIRRLTELRERERFRLALESAASAMVLVDRSGRVVLVNGEAEKLFGRTAAELTGMDVNVLVPERHRGAHPAWLSGFLADPGARRSMAHGRDLSVLRKDGTEVPVEIGLTRIKDEREDIVAASITDITERRRAEEALRRSLAELEAYAYTASHDLRSPLRAISGYADVVRERLSGTADAESAQMLRRIGDSAVRLDRLVQDLLSYGAISRLPVECVPVDLDEVLEHVSRHYPELAAATLRVRRPLGRVKGQMSLLIQTVSNLLTNAAKFVPEGRGAEIDVWSEGAGGGARRLVVKDNGVGIPPDAVEKLFRPFERLQPRGLYGGTGIGLAIVKRAIERMNGRIGVSSRPGEGSEFWLELPEA